MQRLDQLNKRARLPQIPHHERGYDAAIQALLRQRNIWRDRCRAWQLTDVVPYGIATRPNPALLKQESDERQARAAEETQRLIVEYKLSDEQQALQRYKQKYDARPPSWISSLPQLRTSSSSTSRR